MGKAGPPKLPLDSGIQVPSVAQGERASQGETPPASLGCRGARHILIQARSHPRPPRVEGSDSVRKRVHQPPTLDVEAPGAGPSGSQVAWSRISPDEAPDPQSHSRGRRFVPGQTQPQVRRADDPGRAFLSLPSLKQAAPRRPSPVPAPAPEPRRPHIDPGGPLAVQPREAVFELFGTSQGKRHPAAEERHLA